MFLLRISLVACLAALFLMLGACASIGGGEKTAEKEAWSGVPKPYIEGLKSAQKGGSRQAVKLFQQSVEEFPNFVPAYTNMGLQQLRLKDRSNAKKSLSKAVELNPKDSVSYNHLGVIARMDGEFDLALTQYEKALDINPDYALAHLNLGILLDLYLYDFESALEHYEKYQSLVKKKDAKVSKWIVDIKRRIAKNKKS